MAVGSTIYTVLIAMFASIGFILYGFDTGIASTTIAHASFLEYMGHPNNALLGLVVSIYIAGEALGSILVIFFTDKLGRLLFLEVMCVIVTIGVCIQTGAVNIGMFLAGRCIAGIGVGGLSATVPVYLSEIAAPYNRGLIGGISGVGLSFGTMVSNWVGFAGGFAPYGATQWRLPLALQIPWGICLFIGLLTFMPESPRGQLLKGKVDEARTTFFRIRKDLHDHQAQEEFSLMKAQIEFELSRENLSFKDIWQLYRHRVLVAVSVQVLTCVTGVNVIQYYQTILYSSLGIAPRARLALTGAWGTTAFISNAIAVNFLPDRLGRRKMLLAGLFTVICCEIYAAVMQREFQYTDNKVGKGFAILGIYVFAVCYYALINSVTWLYGAECLPISIRGRVMGVSAFAHYAVNVALTQAGPSAFANIHENYYYVFVAACTVYIFIVYFYYPETMKKTLEEIAAEFGDKVVEVSEKGTVAERNVSIGGETKTEKEVQLEDVHRV